MRNLRNIIHDYGGAQKVSDDLNGSRKINAIIAWYKNGIPEQLWPMFVNAGLASIEQLHFLNQLARDGKHEAADVEKALWDIFNSTDEDCYFPSIKKNFKPEGNTQ